jgi:hypothetical protein
LPFLAIFPGTTATPKSMPSFVRESAIPALPRWSYEGRMDLNGVERFPSGVPLRHSLACLVLALIVPACGGAIASGAGVGKVGRGLAAHVDSVPQGAAVCELQEALGTPNPSGEKAISETCKKAFKSDQLWRRTIVVLAAYGEKLEAVSSGTSPETAGRLEGALTGVRGTDWAEADGPTEQAARDAAVQLVNQMGANTSKGHLDTAVKDAAPHVKTLCDGIGSYLNTQAKAFADLRKEVDKKHLWRGSRRCGMLDERTICVSDSVVDRMVYANVFGQMATLEVNHLEASDAVASFCAAHRKLEEAAASGQLSKQKTYSEIVDAVQAVPRSQARWEVPEAVKPADEGKPGKPAAPARPKK